MVSMTIVVHFANDFGLHYCINGKNISISIRIDRVGIDSVWINHHSSFHHHLFESGDMAHTQALTHTHTIHNNTKEGK